MSWLNSCFPLKDLQNAYINEYKTVKPNVTINLETIQSDYPTMLKAKINSGDMPDVFASTAGGEIKAYAEYSADLTDQPLAAAMTDAVRTNMSYNGKVYGFPIKANIFSLDSFHQKFGEIMQGYIAGTYTKEKAITGLTSVTLSDSL